jgi:hypothetical protein
MPAGNASGILRTQEKHTGSSERQARKFAGVRCVTNSARRIAAAGDFSPVAGPGKQTIVRTYLFFPEAGLSAIQQRSAWPSQVQGQVSHMV